MSVEETGARMRKDQSQNPEQVDTSAFEKELSATLQWLTEETSASHPFGDCPETEAIVSHFRNAPRPEVEQHLKDCAKCADLSDHIRRREGVYRRQRDYFLKKLETTPAKEHWFNSVGEVLRQTFYPFAFLLKTRAVMVEIAVVAVLGLCVWQLPNFVAMFRSSGGLGFTTGISANGKIKNSYGLIEKASPADPRAAEIALDELRHATVAGGVVSPATTDAALASVQLKMTAAPDKSDDWMRIQNAIQGYALLNRYAYLRSQKKAGAPIWKDFSGVAKEDGTLLIFLNREPAYDSETYKLLKESRESTAGVDGVVLVTPSDRKVPIR